MLASSKTALYPENMREQGPRRERTFSISEEDVLMNPELKDQFFAERYEARDAGEDVWIPYDDRSDETQAPISQLIRFYRERKLKGFVDGLDEVGHIAYRMPVGEDEDVPVRLTMEDGLTAAEAKKALIDYLDGTVSQDA